MEAVAVACINECERQHVGLHQLGQLIEAVAYATDHSDRLPHEGDVLHMALVVEPETGGGYRRTPVTFESGQTAAHWRDVPEATARLFAHIDTESDPVEIIRAFLAIHPFMDGNGRVAFILLNWLTQTLHDPAPLPDLFD
jgi:hypothetical protein